MESDLSNRLAETMKKKALLDATKNIKKKEEVHVGHNEFKSMQKNKYENKGDTSYVLRNKKTGAIVEIKAVSSLIAAKTVGWRPRHTEVIQENKEEDNE
jgi:hypothetical protein